MSIRALPRHMLVLTACLAAVAFLTPPRLSQAASTGGSLTLASGPDWLTFDRNPHRAVAEPQAVGNAQVVCMNAISPYPCPASATVFGSPFSGWYANLAPIPGANWIWGPGVSGSTPGAELATYWFSKALFIHGEPTNGTFYVGVDDYAEVWVNGRLAGTVGSVVDAGLAGAHTYLTPLDITSLLKPGRNLVTVRAQNGPTWYSPYCDTTCTYFANPAGVVFGGSVTWIAPGASVGQ